METKNHWNKIYAKKQDNEVSWYQTTPETSLILIEKYSLNKSDRIIDIGGGNSELTKALCNNGFKSLTLLDISKEAIERGRAKLMKCKGIQDFIDSDVLDFKPSLSYKVWHDRAVFHFLTQKTDIHKYVNIASKAIEKDGFLILSTFSLTGPEKCSGLPVSKYSPAMLHEVFFEKFELIESFEETHHTPMETKQDFIWVVFKRK